MKVSDINEMVIKFCKEENIPIVCGQIPKEHSLRVKIFLECQKKAYKNKLVYENMSINKILKRVIK